MALIAICPYFEKEKVGFVYCEVCRFRFKDKVMRKNFIGAFCASFDYKSCPICRETDKYYDRKDKHFNEKCIESEEII